MTRQRALVVASGAVLGVIFFASYSNLRIVDPREWTWVMRGADMRLQYIGWQFFRLEPWAFPPGRITRMLYPVGSSVANTGSLPLVAIALKPFNALLPQDFQYFGAWYFLSAVLQGVFAALLVSLIGSGWSFLLLGTALFLLNPVAVPKSDTPGLAAAGWMILAGLYLYFRPAAATTRRRELCGWLALASVAAGSHPYVCVMVLAIAAAFYARRWRPDRALGLFAAVLSLGSVVFAVVVVCWIEGYFVLGKYGDAMGGGLGHWSMNLLGPITPMGWSRFLPEVQMATPGQYEGFVYFGLGILLLAAAGAASLIVRLPNRSDLAALAPLLLACAVIGAVAVSPKVTLGARVLIELPHTLYAPFEPYRASGRFGQLVFYVMLFLLLRRVGRHVPPWGASAIALAVLAVEIADIRHKLEFRGWSRDPSRYTWEQPLHWDSWRFASESYRQMIIVPSDGWEWDTVVAFTFLAARAGLPINTGSAARVDGAALASYRKALQRQLADGPLDATTVYVVHERYLDRFITAHRGRVSCREVDGFHACVADGS